MSTYPINQGKRDFAVRLGCEEGLYNFIHDYAKAMGMSASGAVRRMVLIGARCEKEHGHAVMPASYEALDIPKAPKIGEEVNDRFDYDKEEFNS